MPEPPRVLDIPRTVANVWIRASWRPAHASIVWPVDGVWCHIALRPPRGTPSWQYEFGSPAIQFSAPPRSRMPMPLKTLDERPAVPWLGELRANRARTAEQNDPSRPSRDIPGDVSPRSEVYRVNDSLSRVNTGMLYPTPGQTAPRATGVPTGGYSSNAAQVVGESHQPPARPEPEVEQNPESLAEGPPPSVSYFRALFESHGPPAAPTNPIQSTNGELFATEVATGEEEIIPGGGATGVRPISAYATYPRRESSSSGESEQMIRTHELLARSTAASCSDSH